MSADCQDCNSPPQDPSLFTFAASEAAYPTYREPKSSELAGNWLQVGGVQGGVNIGFGPIGYNANGLGRGLSFTNQTDFYGGTVTSVDTEAWGQPLPYEVTYNKEEAAACFSYFSDIEYAGAPLYTKSHYNYECRLDPANAGRMLCAVRWIYDPQDAVFNLDQTANGKLAAYAAFVHQD